MSVRLPQLEKLHAADPGDADVMYMLAQEYANAGDAPKALQWYDRCLERDPGYLYGYFHKAKVLEMQGDPTRAVVTLREGVSRARSAGNSKALSELSSYLEALGG